jgi:hypothetical protein
VGLVASIASEVRSFLGPGEAASAHWLISTNAVKQQGVPTSVPLVEGASMADNDAKVRDALITHSEKVGLLYMVIKIDKPIAGSQTYHPNTYGNVI